MTKWFEYTFHQRRYMDDKQAHEKRLTSLGIRAKQIKTAMKHHFTLTRVAVIKKKKKTNNYQHWQGTGEIPMYYR